MGAQEYGPHVDVWSGGCVMGEMLRGKVLLPGCDSQQQLTLIVRALGVPDAETLDVMKVVLEASPITLPTEVPLRGLDYVSCLLRLKSFSPSPLVSAFRPEGVRALPPTNPDLPASRAPLRP